MFKKIFKPIHRTYSLLLTSIFLVLPLYAHAESNDFTTNPEVQTFIKQVAAKYNFQPEYLEKLMAQAKFLPDILPKMRHPYEAKPWGDYRDFFMTAERLNEGVAFYNKHQQTLLMAQERYGVPANIIAAIIAVETRYGKIMGDYRVLDTLSTLAFNYPSRAKFFQDELANFFVLTREYHIDPLTVYGSRSGAVGLCQFMPSSYLKYGVSYNDSHDAPDLFTNPKDAIFSIGNYLMQHGWVRGQPITTPAHPIGSRYLKLIRMDPRNIQKPHFSISLFDKYGIKTAGSYNPDDLVYLMRLKEQRGAEYWLGFQNFYAITRYNNSNLYAMAVYQFAKHIEALRQKDNTQ